MMNYHELPGSIEFWRLETDHSDFSKMMMGERRLQKQPNDANGWAFLSVIKQSHGVIYDSESQK